MPASVSRSVRYCVPLVYVGNIAGAVGTAALVFLAGQHGFGGGAVGKSALAVASAKAVLPTIQLSSWPYSATCSSVSQYGCRSAPEALPIRSWSRTCLGVPPTVDPKLE